MRAPLKPPDLLHHHRTCVYGALPSWWLWCLSKWGLVVPPPPGDELLENPQVGRLFLGG